MTDYQWSLYVTDVEAEEMLGVLGEYAAGFDDASQVRHGLEHVIGQLVARLVDGEDV